jgi:hypothetical protein
VTATAEACSTALGQNPPCTSRTRTASRATARSRPSEASVLPALSAWVDQPNARRNWELCWSALRSQLLICGHCSLSTNRCGEPRCRLDSWVVVHGPETTGTGLVSARVPHKASVGVGLFSGTELEISSAFLPYQASRHYAPESAFGSVRTDPRLPLTVAINDDWPPLQAKQSNGDRNRLGHGEDLQRSAAPPPPLY